MTETLIQFGEGKERAREEHSKPESKRAAGAVPVSEGSPGAMGNRATEFNPQAVVCPCCSQRFSFDARFCPFDGELLEPLPGWDPSSDPLLSSVIDERYEVESVLGEGGMGTVYRVRHVVLGRRFALKVLRLELSRESELCLRFIQEARAAATVAHPSVVEITDFGRLAGGQPYFVMELLEGESLRSLIRRGGPLPARRGVLILRQVAEALGAAHALGIIHRDLKPDNVLLEPLSNQSERVKVLDFGLAKVAGGSKITRNGTVFGTPHYMSPEQAAGDEIDPRSDLYSFGVLMYEVFTGKVPFEADSFMGVLTKHLYMDPIPPSEILGDRKQLGALEDVILRCLQKAPKSRYASMEELVSALDSVVAGGAQAARARRAAPGARLADELELPSPEELAAIGLGAKSVRRRVVSYLVAGSIVAFAFAVGFLAVAKTDHTPGASLGRVVSASAPRLASRLSALKPNFALEPQEVLPDAPRKLLPPPPGQVPAVREARARPSRRMATPKAEPRRSRLRMSGEIIDPWADP